MTSKENFKECLECKNHSRVPTFLFDLTFGMEVAGYTTTEIFHNGFDGKKSAKSIMASRKYFHRCETILLIWRKYNLVRRIFCTIISTKWNSSDKNTCFFRSTRTV